MVCAQLRGANGMQVLEHPHQHALLQAIEQQLLYEASYYGDTILLLCRLQCCS